MKSPAIFLAVAALVVICQHAAATPPTHGPVSAEQFGWRVLTSFRHTSVEEYKSLYPTIDELHRLMQERREYYKALLGVSKDDLRAVYYEQLLPELETAFASVIEQGHEKGIDWSKAIFLNASERNSSGKDGEGSVVIDFSCNSRPYQLVVEKVLLVDGNWRTTQFLIVY